MVFKVGTSVFSRLVTVGVWVGRFSADAPWHIEFKKTSESQEKPQEDSGNSRSSSRKCAWKIMRFHSIVSWLKKHVYC